MRGIVVYYADYGIQNHKTNKPDFSENSSFINLKIIFMISQLLISDMLLYLELW